jgi:succinate dehydrogenase/fumarate reductase flavoprotein subunit
VFVDEFARTTVKGLYAAGDMASVPHNYMLGAFTNGAIAGEDAADFADGVDLPAYDEQDFERERKRVLAPTLRSDGIPPNQIEYKTRRLVNDYLQPPKVTTKMRLAQQRFEEIREDLEHNMVVRDSHELMRALEASSILDCAEMAATASLFRTESRWGLYHNRVDHPEKNDADWFCHTLLQKSEGGMVCSKRPVAPYIVPIEGDERSAYDRQRIRQQA